MRSAEQLFMGDASQKKQREKTRKLKQQEMRMAEIREIEQLHTISEDETDKDTSLRKG